MGEVAVFIRRATPADSRRMADLTVPTVTANDLAAWINADTAGAAWHLAEDEHGALLGFQHIARDATLPPEAAAIATFLSPDPLPPGAAARLFDATATAARALGYIWISAAVATENRAALIYYQNRGLRGYARGENRLLMRFDLD